MKIFGLNLSAHDDFRITEEDKTWVEENFRWLKMVFGYPSKHHEQVLLTAEFFPATFESKALSVENALSDLCKLFSLPRQHVRHVMLSDLRDSNNVPYQIEGKAFECETDLKRGDHTIYIANALLKHHDRLLFCLIYEFIRIRLAESEIEYDAGGDDNGLFLYLAGIYYGFGVLLAQNLIHAGWSSEGLWEMKWNYGSEMPQQVMAFSLATYASMQGEDNPSWKNEFKGDFKKMLEGALQYVKHNPNDLFDRTEVTANELFNKADEYFEKRDLDEAIATLQKILFLTNDAHMKADVYNNMGYYYMIKKDYQQGISNFRKALALGSEYGFANDNLGYALIVTGRPEEGLSFVQKAIETGNNDPAYSYRNLALYYQSTHDFAKAEEYFQKAFNQNTPVDLLEFQYGEFLEIQGEQSRAEEFFKKSAEKGEEEGKLKLQQYRIE